MKNIAPIVLLWVFPWVQAQWNEHTIEPSVTDPAIDGHNAPHQVYLYPDEPVRDRLLLFLPGTNALPTDYDEFLITAAEMGYHSIGLSYENLFSINLEVCPQTTDPTCHGRARREIWLGEDAHDSVDVDLPNAIVNRTVKLLRYLGENYPDEGWDQYLIDTNEVNWNRVTIAGHSQGAGNATYGSKLFTVERVVMISWVDWMKPGTNPLWITSSGATPEAAYFGFIHTGDASIYNGIPTTWENLGMNAFGPITSVDDGLPPYGNTHSLISSAPIDLPPLQTNYHNATCADEFTTRTPEGGLLYKPVWQYLLGISDEPTPDPRARRISPPAAGYIDPEILSSANKMAFQTGLGAIWLAELDPYTGGFTSGDGLDVLIDTGATPLLTSFNGPEFGVDAQGWFLVYTKPNQGTPQAWKAKVTDQEVDAAPLTRGMQPRLSILASKDPDAPDSRILYSKGERLSDGTFGFADVSNPDQETIVDSTDTGVRWIDGMRKFFYIKQTGTEKGQVFLYDTETRTQQQVTNDQEVKSYPYGWVAPEYDELIFLVLLNDTRIGIYRDTGGTYWELETVIDVPPASNFAYIGSPETFVANDSSYITFVTKAVNTGASYVDAEVWVVDIEPDPQQRFMLRCDNGFPGTRRTDPESYMGTEEVFVVYNELTEDGDFEIWSFATGIPSTPSNPGEDPPPTTEKGTIHYPNPARDYVYLHQDSPTIEQIDIYTLTGQHIRSRREEEAIYVGDLLPGLYLVRTRSGTITYDFKLVKQ